jgi:hypothetical protein
MKWQDKTLMWCGSVIVAAAVAVAFLFTTFQTNAAADKTQSSFEQRLDKLDSKLDIILEQTK